MLTPKHLFRCFLFICKIVWHLFICLWIGRCFCGLFFPPEMLPNTELSLSFSVHTEGRQLILKKRLKLNINSNVEMLNLLTANPRLCTQLKSIDAFFNQYKYIRFLLWWLILIKKRIFGDEQNVNVSVKESVWRLSIFVVVQRFAAGFSGFFSVFYQIHLTYPTRWLTRVVQMRHCFKASQHTSALQTRLAINLPDFRADVSFLEETC